MHRSRLNTPPHSFRFMLLVLCGLLFSACTVKTLYNQLDWILADHLESYVELDNEQQKYLYARLDAFFLWHKSTQLPLYVSWMKDFQQDILSQSSTDVINHNFDQFKTFLRALRAKAADEAYRILPDLSRQQRESIYASMEEKNEAFADKFIHISREDQLEQYIDRMEDRMEEWLGSLTEQQERLIAQKAVQIQPVASYVLISRRNWQREFKTLLESQADKKALKAGLHDLFVNIERRRAPAYQKRSLQNQRLFASLIADIARIMTPAQKQYLDEKVANYSYHFTDLANSARAEIN